MDTSNPDRKVIINAISCRIFLKDPTKEDEKKMQFGMKNEGKRKDETKLHRFDPKTNIVSIVVILEKFWRDVCKKMNFAFKAKT